MNQVYLLIGGNLHDRFELIAKAKKSISEKIGTIAKESSIYETAPWGFTAEQNFLNQVILLNTDLSAHKVLKLCLEIEMDLGRERLLKGYQSRTMDIDILFYNDEIIYDKQLIIPHERLHQRRFTLEPLVEIAPNYIHPLLKKTLSEILKDCKDDSEVKKS